MSKLRIGVFMGGKTIEREVSFNSGRTICDHLDTSRYEVIPLFERLDGSLYILPWRFLHRGKTSDFEHRLAHEAQRVTWDNLKNLIDIMYIASHGHYTEDGTLQGMLEVLKIPYLGSGILASAIGMDKIIQKEFLKNAGIAVPEYRTIYPEALESLSEAELDSLPLPCIIKPHREGSSLGISVVRKKSDLRAALEKAASADTQKKQAVVIEEYIEGMEFSCIVITDTKTGTLVPLPPTEIVIEDGAMYYDYEQKYMPGRAFKFTPARCADTTIKNIQQTCVRVMEALEFKHVGRIDGFVKKDGSVVIIDPNTFSGMAPSSFIFLQAAELNMSHTTIINHLIETALADYHMLDKLKSIDQENAKKQHHKMRVAVLLGGRSNEKEISLESGRNILYKLSPEKYTAIPIFIDNNLELHVIDQHLLVRNSTAEIAHGLKPEMLIGWSDLPAIADFVFIGLHGGEGENGAVQGALETLGLPYNGSSVLASSLCMNKQKTNAFLKTQGFDVPAHIFLAKQEYREAPEKTAQFIESSLCFPVIVKPHDDGCSVLVAKAKNQQELHEALEELFEQKDHALVEECIQGMELTVGVIGNNFVQALPPSQAISAKDILSIEEKFLPGQGENQTPAPLPAVTLDLVKDVMQKVYKALGCKGYARIDCFYQSAERSPTGQERIVIIEVNSLPGMTPATCIFHQAAEIGIRPMDFIDLIIQLGVQEHSTQPARTDQQIIGSFIKEISPF